MAVMQSETIPWLQSLGCLAVCITKLFYRRPGDYTRGLDLGRYNAKVDDFNNKLATSTVTMGPHSLVTFWDNRDVLQSGKVGKIWDEDGVHLNADGHPCLAKSLRGAVMTTLKLVRRYV